MSTHASRLKLLLNLLLLCCSSINNTALAFASSPSAQIRAGGDLSVLDKQFAMPSLRVRGGGGAPSLHTKTKLSTATANYDGEKAGKMANEALKSMQYCSKMCLFSVVVDIVVFFVDEDIWSKFLGPGTTLSWVNCAQLFDSLSLLAFGAGK